jgi:NADP-dependent 3-hydroxy acid dehydrogenase YdfG
MLQTSSTQISIIVTGVTVGSEIARHLSEIEIKVYAACRSAERINKIRSQN